MKYWLILTVMLGACSVNVPPTSQDMAMVVEVPDLAKPIEDMAIPAPIDMALPSCLTPKPGIYVESTYFGARNVSTGADQFYGNSNNVGVQPDGMIVRPKIPITTVQLWHCDSASMANPENCQSVCCDGDPTVVPTIYWSINGWSLFKPGQCTWHDSNNIVWYIDVQAIAGRM